MHVTTVRGRWYENFLTLKFNGRKYFDTKISRITVYEWSGTMLFGNGYCGLVMGIVGW